MQSFRDIRLQGFANRVPVAAATAWIDARCAALPSETLPLAEAFDRILAADIAAPRALPPVPRSGIDGYAVRAADTVGASGYAPLTLRLIANGAPLTPGTAALVEAGHPLPPGADTMLPFTLCEPGQGTIDVLNSVAAGADIESAGDEAGAGALLLAAGRCLHPADLGLAAITGLDTISVVRHPRVRLIPATPGLTADANTPMLTALIHRDGGQVEPVRSTPTDSAALRTALNATDVDLIVVCGRTGTGPEDFAAPVLAEAGELAFHGLALRPGDSTGLGRVAGVPVILLPGPPAACFYAAELLVGRAVRRLAGRPADLPHRTVVRPLRRKLTSEVGSTDIFPVRLSADGAEPIPSGSSFALYPTVQADGFVIVPAELEGYAPGTAVAIFLNDPI
jgi:molybdopterin molybdotransferase